jgi:hypothetical protein
MRFDVGPAQDGGSSMAKDPDPSSQEWGALYEAAASFKALAPWKWMREHQIFCVADPEGREVGYCGVTGADGEHMSLIVNLGTEGLSGYLTTLELGDVVDPLELLFIQRNLMSSFEDRGLLRKEDRDVIKGLGLSFRGKGAWPLFRSFRPGFLPWTLTSWEARFLRACLEQAIDVTGRVRDDPELIDLGEDSTLLSRVAVEDRAGIEWRDERRPVPNVKRPPVPRPDLDITRAKRRLEGAKRLDSVWEVDMFHIPEAAQERKGDRPYFPRLALWVDLGTGLVVGHSMFGPVDTPDLSMATLRVIERMGMPRSFVVQRPEVASLLEPLAELGGIGLQPAERLEGIESARMSMMSGFR